MLYFCPLDLLKDPLQKTKKFCFELRNVCIKFGTIFYNSLTPIKVNKKLQYDFVVNEKVEEPIR
jgi:hypothetical protein